MSDNNLHKGHRQRMMKKYLNGGIDNFEEHEILEIALFYVFPRVNTNDIAHRLIAKFGSLKGVFSAKSSELNEIKGIGENASFYINFLFDLHNKLNEQKLPAIRLDSSAKLLEYCRNLFTDSVNEEVHVLLLNEKFYLMSDIEVTGEISRSGLDTKYIVRKALEFNCSSVILTHNHPTGTAIASAADITSTRTLAQVLKTVDVKLDDHIIICPDSEYSLRSTELLKDIWC